MEWTREDMAHVELDTQLGLRQCFPSRVNITAVPRRHVAKAGITDNHARRNIRGDLELGRDNPIADDIGLAIWMHVFSNYGR